tara:strand:- start:68 stop:460 length:393 start_codon:yes stop_codon:yes gene_type:complete
MENYIIPDNLSVEDFSKLGETLCLYEEFKTNDLRIKLHEVAMEVGCKMKNEIFWCQHKDCLESTDSFENEKELNDHIQEKHSESNTIIVENLGEIFIPPRNTKEEILKIIEFYKDDIDILYELLDFVEEY